MAFLIHGIHRKKTMLKNLNMSKLLETGGKELLSQLRRLNNNLEKIIEILESNEKINKKHNS